VKKTIFAASIATLASGCYVVEASASTYTVKAGDSLWEIANQHGISVTSLKSMNHLKNDNLLPNQVLSISTIKQVSKSPAPTVKTTKQAAKFYTVKPGDSLLRIANQFNLTLGELKSLNKLSSTLIVPGQKLNVSDFILINDIKPASSLKPVVKSKPLETTQTDIYTVKAGDTLGHIAIRSGVSINQLKEWNQLKVDTIYTGQKLSLKIGPTVVLPSSPPVKMPVVTKPTATTVYVVKSGDTLGHISLLFGVSLADLRNWNQLKNDKIFVGQQLNIQKNSVVSPPPPPTSTATSGTTPASTTSTYVVKSGDTLGSIAGKNGLSVNDLRTFNSLKSDIIYVGQLLKLKDTADSSVPVQTPPPLSTDKTDFVPSADAIVAEAMKWIGTPYVWGGSSSAGFDCSGYVYFVMKQTGSSINRFSSDGYYNRSYTVSNPKPGDLVFFADTYRSGISHLGFYLGNNKFIHAANEKVEISSLDNVYWKSKFDSFKRFY
jgi:LysM repeat protein